MPLDGTYIGLKASIADYLMRDDLALVIPDFITMGENRAARRIRVSDMETVATGVLTNGAATLPSDFLELRRVINSGTATNTVLTPITPGRAGTEFRGINSGVPERYTITGNTITTYPGGGNGSLTIDYYAKPPALSVLNPTNWLLTKAPEIYLYAALIESAPYLGDDTRVGVWGTMFNQACDMLQSNDDRARWGRMVSRVDSRYLP